MMYHASHPISSLPKLDSCRIECWSIYRHSFVFQKPLTLNLLKILWKPNMLTWWCVYMLTLCVYAETGTAEWAGTGAATARVGSSQWNSTQRDRKTWASTSRQRKCGNWILITPLPPTPKKSLCPFCTCITVAGRDLKVSPKPTVLVGKILKWF